MFERPPVTSLPEVVGAVRTLPAATDTAEQIEQILQLEDLACAVAATQARITATFTAARRAERIAAGTPSGRAGDDVAAQVGLARRMSPFHARRYTAWARILVEELPQTFAARSKGTISEWRAMTVARETAWLSREHRAQLDAQIAPRLAGLGDRRVEAEVKTAAYRLDPDGYVGRVRGAATDRRVTLRPAPDTMTRLTGFLPVTQGVAALAALRRHADTLISDGDPRSRGQIMADTMVERLTGQQHATDVPLTINLVMTDQTLTPLPSASASADADTESKAEADTGSEAAADSGTGADVDAGVDTDDAADGWFSSPWAAGAAADLSSEPAVLDGYGPIPAAVARDLIRTPSDQTPIWLRRLYLSPAGRLIAAESTRRAFTPSQREFLRLRDQTCRTPWCDAPIRHADHVTPAAGGGPTSLHNGQGLCEACNYAKQAPGWQASAQPDGEISLITPTGHRYHSRAPDPPGASYHPAPYDQSTPAAA